MTPKQTPSPDQGQPASKGWHQKGWHQLQGACRANLGRFGALPDTAATFGFLPLAKSAIATSKGRVQMRFSKKAAQWIKDLLSSSLVLRLLEVVDRRTENRMTEFGMLAQAVEFVKINGVEGDYFEFGLWRGKTFIYAHRMMRRYNVQRKLRGFDSFQGLPDHAPASDNIWHKGQFAYSRADLEADLRKAGFRVDDYELIEGFYETSLSLELSRQLLSSGVRASIVYIDCDLYESTKPVLKFISPFLQNGTVMCFDDYYNYKGDPQAGEAKALAELLASNPEYHFIPYLAYSPLGQSFIVRVHPSSYSQVQEVKHV
jgi:O-methyltransferase